MSRADTLPCWRWRGVDRQGAFCSGLLLARDRAHVRTLLKARLIMPRRIRRVLYLPRLNTADLTAWLDQLRHLLAAGLPMTRALSLLVTRSSTPALFCFTAHVEAALHAGHSLSHALAHAPIAPSVPSLLALVNAGEINGRLPEVLAHIVRQRQRDARWRTECRRRASYPLFLLGAGSLIAFGLLTYVVPSFAQLYAQQQRRLPALTEQLLVLSSHAGILISGLACIAIGVAMLYWQRHRHWISALLAPLPIIGALYRQCGALEVLQLIRLGHATHQALDTFIEHLLPHYRRHGCLHALLVKLAYELRQGTPLSQSLRACRIGHAPFLPDTQHHCIVLGEQSGTLPELLTQAIEALERDISTQMTRLSQWIEPALMAALALGVGSIMLGMYLPVFDMGSVSW